MGRVGTISTQEARGVGQRLGRARMPRIPTIQHLSNPVLSVYQRHEPHGELEQKDQTKGDRVCGAVRQGMEELEDSVLLRTVPSVFAHEIYTFSRADTYS